MLRYIRILLLIFILALTFYFTGQAGSTPGPNVFLWEIRSGSESVYLLGSIHVARQDLYPLDRRIEDSFANSDVLVVEVNINEIDIMNLQSFIEKGVYLYGESIKDHISAKTFELLKKKLSALGMSIEEVSFYQPWFLALNLELIELAKLGFNAAFGIDSYFLQKAQGNKDIAELESFQDQLNVLSGFSDKEQELFLLSTISELEMIESYMNELFGAWKAGNVEAMRTMLEAEMDKHPELLPIYDKLFYQRNLKMTDKIEGFLKKDKSHFVIIGAGHLIGKKGIIQLLKDRGHNPQQL